MAFFKGSAYEFTPLFEVSDHTAKSFRGLRARTLRKPIPLLEHSVEMRQRLDNLAHEYYAESRDWRWIMEANSDVLFPDDLLWTTTDPTYDEHGTLIDEGTQTENGSERAGHVIIIPQREDTGKGNGS